MTDWPVPPDATCDVSTRAGVRTYTYRWTRPEQGRRFKFSQSLSVPLAEPDHDPVPYVSATHYAAYLRRLEAARR